MPSREILDKLFEVEKKAEAIVSAAREEAEKRIAEAKEASEVAFKAAYEGRAAELGKDLEEAKKQADIEFRGELAAHRSKLETAKKDLTSFALLCDELLSGKA